MRVVVVVCLLAWVAVFVTGQDFIDVSAPTSDDTRMTPDTECQILAKPLTITLESISSVLHYDLSEIPSLKIEPYAVFWK